MQGRSGVAVILAVLSACAAPSHRHGRAPLAGPAQLNKYTLPVQPLIGRVITQPNELQAPTQLTMLSGKLVVIDHGAEAAISVLDPHTGAIRRAIGATQNDPDSLAGIRNIDAHGTADSVWAYDFHRREFDLLNTTSPHAVVRRVALAAPWTLTGAVWATPTTILSPAFSDSGRFAAFAPDGRFLGYRGALPTGVIPAPAHVRQHAFQSVMAVDSASHIVVLGTRHADRIEMYSPTGDLLRVADRPFGFEPVFSVANDGRRKLMAVSDSTRFGYLDVAAANGYIVGLFSGRLFGASRTKAALGDYLHVFSTDGRLRRVFRVDADLVAIAYDAPSHTIYGLTAGQDPQIRSYVLDLSHSLVGAGSVGAGSAAPPAAHHIASSSSISREVSHASFTQ